MKKGGKRFSIEGIPLYPHIKLTRERFPRVYATRLIEHDDSEYFGAFLNRTNARILIDFLNRTFRLRSCDIDVDGSFNYPCTMHYKGRCLAPCVSDLITEEQYVEMVGLVRLFLANDRGSLYSSLSAKIDKASEELQFESAAAWRDILTAVEAYWAVSRQSVWLDATSDTFHIKETEEGLDVFLISQKGRRVLGERIFSFDGAKHSDRQQALSELISEFYKFHVPKEIRVPFDLVNRLEIEQDLEKRFGRRVQIITLNQKNRKISTDRAMRRSGADLDLKRAQVQLSPLELLEDLRRSFNLGESPSRIIAVDTSHISGTDQAAAAVSWQNGRIDAEGAESRISNETSELRSLQAFVRELIARHKVGERTILLVDGGPAQLAAVASLDANADFSLIAAVKPRGEHEAISHFLLEGIARVDFDMSRPSHRLLLRLRDEAHEFANSVHRDTREYRNHYRMATLLPSLTESERRAIVLAFGSIAAVDRSKITEVAQVVGPERAILAKMDLERYQRGESREVLPLVVPTSLQAENGAAEDLRPIEARASSTSVRKP